MKSGIRNQELGIRKATEKLFSSFYFLVSAAGGRS